MAHFLYKRGNGNEGNYARCVVWLDADQCPYAALRALVANDYIAGKRVRRHIMRTIETDGDAEYGVNATIYEGPDGDTAFGAAYITAELEPVAEKDVNYTLQNHTSFPELRDALDRGAWTWFRKGAE